MNRLNIPPQLKGFIDAWKQYIEYILNIKGISTEDVEICKNALILLTSDAPKRLYEEVFSSSFVHQSTLDDAEEVDNALLRVKLIVLPVSKSRRKELEKIGGACISFQKLLLSLILHSQNRIKEED